MNDKASEVRAAAATTLGELARDTSNPAVIDALIDLFRDSDWTVRSSALQVRAPFCPCLSLHRPSAGASVLRLCNQLWQKRVRVLCVLRSCNVTLQHNSIDRRSQA
jgi:hypothetical protein